MFIVLSILLSVLGILSIISMLVLWIMAIYDAAVDTTTEIKNARVLWILLIVIGGLIGGTIYFFVSGKKKKGIWTIVSMLSLPILLVIFAIISTVVRVV